MQTSENIGLIAAALAKAQQEIRNPALDSVNPHFRNRYASLAAHLDAVREPLGKHGIAMVQGMETGEGTVRVTTMLAHASGEWIKAAVEMPMPDRATAQQVGATVTYLRRYSLATMSLIVGDEDDDGEGDRAVRQRANPAPAASAKPAPAPAPTPAAKPAAAAKPSPTRDALFGDKPVAPAAKPAQEDKGWDADGMEIVRILKVVDRDGGAKAVLCDHPDDGQKWVQFGPEVAGQAVENRRVELVWEFSDQGFARAVEVRAAPKLIDAVGGAK